MILVTPTAKEKFKEILQESAKEPELTFRLFEYRSKPIQLSIGLDKERNGDLVVESKEGTKLLLIGPSLAAEGEGLVIDFEETKQGTGFTFSMPAPRK